MGKKKIRGADLQESHEQQLTLRDEVAGTFRGKAAELLEPDDYTCTVTSKAAELDEYFGFSGALLFLAEHDAASEKAHGKKADDAGYDNRDGQFWSE